MDGRLGNPQKHHFNQSSGGLRNLLAGRSYEDGLDEAPPRLSTKRIMKANYENLPTGSRERHLIDAEMCRKDYDANRFCNGENRRIKAGPGWEGPDLQRSEKMQRIAASNPMYGNHHFFLGKKRSDIRAGTDDMMRTLGGTTSQRERAARAKLRTNGSMTYILREAQH